MSSVIKLLDWCIETISSFKQSYLNKSPVSFPFHLLSLQSGGDLVLCQLELVNLRTDSEAHIYGLIELDNIIG